mgnify:CR=1 FL=1
MTPADRHRARRDLANQIFDTHFRDLAGARDPDDILEVLEHLNAQAIAALKPDPKSDAAWMKSVWRRSYMRLRQNRTCELGPIRERAKPELTVIMGGKM